MSQRKRRKRLAPRCPHCGERNTFIVLSSYHADAAGWDEMERLYRCADCNARFRAGLGFRFFTTPALVARPRDYVFTPEGRTA